MTFACMVCSSLNAKRDGKEGTRQYRKGKEERRGEERRGEERGGKGRGREERSKIVDS